MKNPQRGSTMFRFTWIKFWFWLFAILSVGGYMTLRAANQIGFLNNLTASLTTWRFIVLAVICLVIWLTTIGLGLCLHPWTKRQMIEMFIRDAQ